MNKSEATYTTHVCISHQTFQESSKLLKLVEGNRSLFNNIVAEMSLENTKTLKLVLQLECCSLSIVALLFVIGKYINGKHSVAFIQKHKSISSFYVFMKRFF